MHNEHLAINHKHCVTVLYAGNRLHNTTTTTYYNTNHRACDAASSTIVTISLHAQDILSLSSAAQLQTATTAAAAASLSSR